MSRMVGTISRGVRAPIIRQGDDLAEIVTNCILEAAAEDGYSIRNRDIVAMTESIVARAQQYQQAQHDNDRFSGCFHSHDNHSFAVCRSVSASPLFSQMTSARCR